ncbi:MAG: UDP-N-acetylglucosamine--N-acetylmuramyl-(pentapeptide) pyrophosphoryl-undecaprenol N-acetylglucosamine transferase, partial [Clostridia bacterium]|nr:UDP-N-acetylglucosamine--N-acetylmuramyl-(pentapeptide) pyrophosphoryl-undecaprenol N-acetylglucosamine transferase [Clostridia bacterium]
PGKAVKMVEKYVDRIYTNFPGVAEKLRRKDKVMRVGNPLVSEDIVAADAGLREKLGIPAGTKCTVLSFGGSRGAAAINEHVINFIASYAKAHPEMFFVHATGSAGYKVFREKAEQCGVLALPNVRIEEYIYDMPLWEAAADIVICRAGAMTISEMALGKKACIFIPSPYVAENHQYMNAKVLADAGAAMLIEEKDLSEQSLRKCVEEIYTQEEKSRSMRRNIEKFALHGAAETIFKDMQELMSEELLKLIKQEDAK